MITIECVTERTSLLPDNHCQIRDPVIGEQIEETVAGKAIKGQSFKLKVQ